MNKIIMVQKTHVHANQQVTNGVTLLSTVSRAGASLSKLEEY